MLPPDIRAALASIATALGVALDEPAADRLVAYLMLLQRWNATYNLTAVRDPSQMLTHHVADCMAVVPLLMRHTQGRSTKLLDVGSGGGLPGVVIAALCPQVEVTCVDSVGKKAAFIRQVAAELNLAHLRGEHARVEELSGRFDVVASRAFATLADFCRLTSGAISEGGVWMAMKGKVPQDEIASISNKIEVFHVEPVEVPGLDAERCVVWLRPAR
jgi:16S rRNA (guanine527-N7)-methyltransferase